MPGPVRWTSGLVTGSGVAFQSYDTIIAFMVFNGDVYLDKDAWDYSVTTGKYRNKFLQEDKKTTQQKIKDGKYKLENLN